jgi:hypothetical protein
MTSFFDTKFNTRNTMSYDDCSDQPTAEDIRQERQEQEWYNYDGEQGSWKSASPIAEEERGVHVVFSSSDDDTDTDTQEDYGKKTTIFNKKALALAFNVFGMNTADESTDSELEDLLGEPPGGPPGFGEIFSRNSQPCLELPKPNRLARQINNHKWELPLKMLKHFRLHYIHVETKWVFKTDKPYTNGGGVRGAWVYAIFKLRNDEKQELVPKKVTIYVPEYYASSAYDCGRKDFDDQREFWQFLRSPQWWREVSEFSNNSRLV